MSPEILEKKQQPDNYDDKIINWEVIHYTPINGKNYKTIIPDISEFHHEVRNVLQENHGSKSLRIIMLSYMLKI